MNTHSMIKKIVLAMVTSGVLLTPTVSAAPLADREHHKMRGHQGERMIKKMAYHLDLSEAQITDLKAIKKQHVDKNKTLRTSKKAFREQVSVLKDNVDFDEQAFSATYLQYQDTFAQIAMQKAKRYHAIYQVLNDEQRKKWDTFKQKIKRLP